MISKLARLALLSVLAATTALGSYGLSSASDKFMFRPPLLKEKLIGEAPAPADQPIGAAQGNAAQAQSASAPVSALAATAHRYWRFRATSVRTIPPNYKLQLTGLMFLDASGNPIIPVTWYEPGTVTVSNQIANLFDSNASTLKHWFYATSGGMTGFGNSSSVRVDFGVATAISGISINAYRNPVATGGYYTQPPLKWAVEYSDNGYPGPWTVAFTGANPIAAWEADQHYEQIVP